MYFNPIEFSRMPGGIDEYLEDLNASTPVRVLHGNWSEYHPQPWTLEQAEATGHDLGTCDETGITIVSCGWPAARCRPRDTNFQIDALSPDFLDAVYGVGGWTGRTHHMMYDVLSGQPTDEYDTIELGGAQMFAVQERTLWIAMSIANFDSSGRQAFTADTLTAAIDELLDPTLAEERTLLAVERNRQRFIEMLSQVNTTERDNLVSEIEALARALSSTERNLHNLRTELRSKQRLLDAYMAAGDEDHDELAQRADTAWERMSNDPRIEKLSLTGNTVTLLTAPLNITHPDTGEVAYLGRFRWTFNTRDLGTTVTNLDNPRGGFDHPHVNNGGPCFGEMGDTIYELLRQGRLESAVEMMFVFLSSANPRDDWGRRITYWFTPENLLDDTIDEIENEHEHDEDYEEAYA